MGGRHLDDFLGIGPAVPGSSHFCEDSANLPQKARTTSGVFVNSLIVTVESTNIGKVLTWKRIGQNINIIRKQLTIEAADIYKILISENTDVYAA